MRVKEEKKMINPTIEELTDHGKIDRYTLVIATAKAARKITDNYIKEREQAEKMIAEKVTDKQLSDLVSHELSEKNAVQLAIDRLNNKTYRLVESSLPKDEDKKD